MIYLLYPFLMMFLLYPFDFEDKSLYLDNIINLYDLNLEDSVINIRASSSKHYYEVNRDFYRVYDQNNRTFISKIYYKEKYLFNINNPSISGKLIYFPTKDYFINFPRIGSKNAIASINCKTRKKKLTYFNTIDYVGYNKDTIFLKVRDTISNKEMVVSYANDSLKEVKVFKKDCTDTLNDKIVENRLIFFNGLFQFNLIVIKEKDTLYFQSKIIYSNNKVIYLKYPVFDVTHWIIDDSSVIYFTYKTNKNKFSHIQKIKKVNTNGLDEELINFIEINDEYNYLLGSYITDLYLKNDYLLVLRNDSDIAQPFVYNTKTKKIEERKINIIWEEQLLPLRLSLEWSGRAKTNLNYSNGK